jgi:hypothetical protein
MTTYVTAHAGEAFATLLLMVAGIGLARTIRAMLG